MSDTPTVTASTRTSRPPCCDLLAGTTRTPAVHCHYDELGSVVTAGDLDEQAESLLRLRGALDNTVSFEWVFVIVRTGIDGQVVIDTYHDDAVAVEG